jgi:hypothetical protein
MDLRKRSGVGLGSVFFALVMSVGLCSSSFADQEAGSSDLQAELQNEAPVVDPYVIESPVPIAWESPHRPEAKLWSEYSYRVINQYFDELDKARDVHLFCPKYHELERDDRIMVWADIMAGISYWETGWDPKNRTLEGGVDDITQKPTYSEGLLQLSYVDVESNPYCIFDFRKDETLSVEDLHRSILNPYNNLYCGIRTMADLIRDNKFIVVPKDGYWSTIQSGSIHNRAPSIELVVRNLPFCGKHAHETISDEFYRVVKEAQKEYKKFREKTEKH